MDRISWKLLRFRTQKGLNRADASLRSTTEDGQDQGAANRRAKEIMAKLAQVTCADCYFRRSGLCALRTEVPCPTFRAYARGALAPSLQAPLVPRRPLALAAQHAVA
jgi:hypothetical protein